MTQTALAKKTAAKIAADDDQRWAGVVARDKSCDGQFFYSVATTGVYCRPSCPSRMAKRGNVEFHATAAEAGARGFRPCKRCRPDELSLDARQAKTIADACRLIETAHDAPTLQDLAAASGMSAFHFHRIFKTVTGVTPKEYAVAHRQNRVRRNLKETATVTQAIYDSGFNSSARFYADAKQALGMSASDFRAGGKNAVLRFAIGDSSLGSILVAASDKGIAAIIMGDDPHKLLRELEVRFPRAKLVGGDRAFEKIVALVVGAAENPSSGLDLPLDVRGTAFQHRVWRALREIPLGTTMTYTQVARRIGMPRAVRAVARACATNMHAIAIPCHRVIRSDGSYAGYRWGIKVKKALIEREACKPSPRGGAKKVPRN